LLVSLTLVLAPATARAELPEPFGGAGMSDDYRFGYALSVGVWEGDQATLHHRVRMQIPLWSVAAGAVAPFANAIGDVDDSTMGNLRLYVQWFHDFSIARRANLRIGGGLDAYLPTATRFTAVNERDFLVTGPAVGESAAYLEDMSFAFRPRLHVGGEVWIFSFQGFAGVPVILEGSSSMAGFDWGVTLAATFYETVALAVETTGTVWLDERPESLPESHVSAGAGLRFLLPHGWQPAIWVRGPLTEEDTLDREDVSIGVELLWRHDRRWLLF